MENGILKAKRIFDYCGGSEFQMKKHGLINEYLSYNITEEMEQKWLKEIIENGGINNVRSIQTDKGFMLIKQLVSKNYTGFTIEKEYNKGGFYGYMIIIKNGDIEVMLGAERGFIDYSLKISDKIIDLFKYEQRLGQVEASSAENFYFVSSVIKRFINERNMGN